MPISGRLGGGLGTALGQSVVKLEAARGRSGSDFGMARRRSGRSAWERIRGRFKVVLATGWGRGTTGIARATRRARACAQVLLRSFSLGALRDHPKPQSRRWHGTRSNATPRDVAGVLHVRNLQGGRAVVHANNRPREEREVGTELVGQGAAELVDPGLGGRRSWARRLWGQVLARLAALAACRQGPHRGKTPRSDWSPRNWIPDRSWSEPHSCV